MKWWELLPWKSIARRIARRHGFFDPVQFLDRMRQFAKPSEVGEPIELLRAGAVFHARGLINRAVQFNLDWVWPYWIERQFNPADESFVPRAFSFSHINVTHRNWTAVGLPGLDLYPIVDPRGLVTPCFDGWSLDFWIVGESGEPLLLPSKAKEFQQRVETGADLRVISRISQGKQELSSEVFMTLEGDTPCCVVRVRATGGKLVVAARPYNPEGISFIDSIAVASDREWVINGKQRVQFSATPERVAMSCYEGGDVLQKLLRGENHDAITCRVGMATAGAVFSSEMEVRVPLDEIGTRRSRPSNVARWRDELSSCAKLEIPDARWQRLYETAVSTLILHAPHEVYPGPYTYKRFWYRDAAFILNALASIGAHERCRRVLDVFPRGQLSDGYFRSQEGEWDSNGEVLWIIERCFELSGKPMPDEWLDMIERAARWILNKRIRTGENAGLLPAGFSAEHLGLNDFYYWDDFWGVAGLRCAARLLKQQHPARAAELSKAADEFMRVIEQAIADGQLKIANVGGFAARTPAIAAAPDRRMDSGAVGSLVADFPLQLFAPADPRILNTVEWLMNRSFFGGGFFQEMIHSGINAYLTLHVAQVLLRAGDARALDLIETIARIASPTGQWPEAIHPRTLGGCMGDGQHVWAAAEWVMMMRNLFVREEGAVLVIGAGVRPDWLERGNTIRFGPAATAFGAVTVKIQTSGGATRLELEPHWRSTEPLIEVRVPGFKVAARESNRFTLAR
ncbi:MAG TPA: hypothetical protein VK530_07670 [Candidatus Acidoferrum sp.]|nr:hypothetical protein [Candidatus Acidoferrum sp.]